MTAPSIFLYLFLLLSSCLSPHSIVLVVVFAIVLVFVSVESESEQFAKWWSARQSGLIHDSR